MSKMRFFALQELANRKPLEVEIPSNKLTDYYGSHVFDRKKMQEYLPKEAYQAVVNAIEKGTPINRATADLVANGMKNWAKSLNVTHYTHWYPPRRRARRHPRRCSHGPRRCCGCRRWGSWRHQAPAEPAACH